LSSLLSDVLETALRSAMSHLSNKALNELLTGYGPLSTLQAKIDLAYGMKLLTDQHCKNAHLIRKIRNTFAHEPKRLDFGCAEIVKIGVRLSTYEKQKGALDAYTKALDDIMKQLRAEIGRHMTAAALAKP
jgi:DNA-binding MltR family transcriptional regulator